MIRASVSVTFEHPTAAVRQGDSVLPLVEWHTLNQVLLFEVPQVGRVVPRIAQIPFRDNARRADGRQRARVRSVQHVITVAIVDEFPLEREAFRLKRKVPHIGRTFPR